MQRVRNFSISDSSTILVPGIDGLDTFAEGIRRGCSIIARQSQHPPILLGQDAEQMLYCETSGTSGGAKTIRRRPITWIRSFEINQRRFALDARDTYATFGHPGHSMTLYAIAEALHIGADILPLAGLPPRRQVLALIEKPASILYATPSQLHLLARGAEAQAVEHIPGVRHIVSGGGKLEPALRRAIARLIPEAEIHEFFGASETSFISITNAGTPEGSVGLPYPGVLLEIRNDGPVAAMETGEIWVKSPYLFDGYEGAASADTRWEGEFLTIGEMGYLDARGYLFLRGRKNRMVTVADVNVFPEEIEKLVMAIPRIGRCAALAQPDEKRGHRVICVIEGKGSTQLETQLRRKCREVLGAHSVPHRFVFLDAIPLLAAGKPDLQALRRQLGFLV